MVTTPISSYKLLNVYEDSALKIYDYLEDLTLFCLINYDLQLFKKTK